MSEESPYVSRAGLKLEHALRTFGVDATGLRCADLGCNVGGFTDCLLRYGAAHVHAVDTAYGELAWRLRQDERVTVLERTNALHLENVLTDEQFDLIVIDLGWTRQEKAIPAALPWLAPGGRIITLIKPHYEATAEEKAEYMTDGALSDAGAQAVMDRVIDEIASTRRDESDKRAATVRERSVPAPVTVLATTQSPIRGGKSSRKSGKAGNVEFLAMLRS